MTNKITFTVISFETNEHLYKTVLKLLNKPQRKIVPVTKRNIFTKYCRLYYRILLSSTILTKIGGKTTPMTMKL